MQQNHSEASSTFKWESFQSGQAKPEIIVLSWNVTDSNTCPWCEMKLSWQMRYSEPVTPGSMLALALHDSIGPHSKADAPTCWTTSMCAAGRAAAPVTAWQHSSGQEGLYSTRIWLSSITGKLKSSQISGSTSYVLRSLPKFSTSNEKSQRGHCCQCSPHYSVECHISPFFTTVLNQHSTKPVSQTRTQKVRKMDSVIPYPKALLHPRDTNIFSSMCVSGTSF